MSTILVVEDEVGLRLAIAGQLAPLGDILVARTKEEGLETIQGRAKVTQPIDLAVVDLRLAHVQKLIPVFSREKGVVPIW